ncbi:YncE family protein [Actinosynnema sp. NPDC053489]|uniref:YncE family protein n=1 Tax=Actinosynnema sp. NPDC053489 TaxID=3363916 RepID=UPI0037C99D65
MTAPTTIPVVRSLPSPGDYLCGLTWFDRLLWQSDQDAGRIWAVEPGFGEVVRELECDRVRADLTHHDGLLCQVGGRPKRLVLVDPATGGVVGTKAVTPSNGRLCGVEATAEGVWMCLRAPAVLQLRDFETMTVLREIPVEGSPSGLTAVNRTAVYAEFDTGLVRAVDTRTGRITGTARVEGAPTGMAWDGYSLWYCDFRARRLKAIRLDDVLR